MASVDRRDLILNRIWVVLQTVPGLNTFWRNRDGLTVQDLPGLVMLDGDEDGEPEIAKRSRPPSTPVFVTMKPEIYFQVKPQKPKNETVHTELHEIRKQVIKRLLTDATLQTLLGGNGSIAYVGMMSDLARGRANNGEMGLMFNIDYVLRPTEL